MKLKNHPITPNPYDEWNVNRALLFGQQKVEYAGFWLRVIASFIDSFILTFAFSVIFGLAGMLCAIFAPTFFAIWGEKLQNISAGEDQVIRTMLAVVTVLYGFSFILNWLYFAVFEASSYQATPGKMALDLKVTDTEGKKISFVRASIRFWAKIPSGLILCIGFMMAGWTEKKQCLHDILTDTFVIKK